MPKPRSTSRRHGRKQLNAELERLTVPVRAAGPPQGDADDRDREPPQGAADARPEDDVIRRMIEAAYT